MQSITYQQNLSGENWQLADRDGEFELGFNVPGDVHSTLLAHEKITDPYWRDTETSLDWVHEREWIACKKFEFDGDISKRHFLLLNNIDCLALVFLNDQKIGTCDNQFLRWDFDVSSALLVGENELRIEFLSNSQGAKERAEASEIPIPYISFNNRLPHYNFLRKTQCHAGWDWNIALSPIGIYGDVCLYEADALRFDDLMVRQNHLDNADVELEVEAFFSATTSGTTTFMATICGQEVSATVDYYPASPVRN